MNGAYITGFHVDRDQTLYVSDVVDWCEKRDPRWKRDVVAAPPKKSKILAAYPNPHPSEWLRWTEYPVNDSKVEPTGFAWEKAPA